MNLKKITDYTIDGVILRQLMKPNLLGPLIAIVVFMASTWWSDNENAKRFAALSSMIDRNQESIQVLVKTLLAEQSRRYLVEDELRRDIRSNKEDIGKLLDPSLNLAPDKSN